MWRFIMKSTPTSRALDSNGRMTPAPVISPAQGLPVATFVMPVASV